MNAENKYRKLRRKLKMNQTEFWSQVGHDQSSGSRYENGREPSVQTKVLIELILLKGDQEAISTFKRVARAHNQGA